MKRINRSTAARLGDRLAETARRRASLDDGDPMMASMYAAIAAGLEVDSQDRARLAASKAELYVRAMKISTRHLEWVN